MAFDPSRISWSTRRATVCALFCATLVPAGLRAQQPDSYYEFGTVLAVGQNSIDVQTYSQDAHGPIRQTFLLTPDTRADLVRLGDQVEVLYTASGESLQLRRLLILTGGIPRFGPPPAAAPHVAAARPPAPAPAPAARPAPAQTAPTQTAPIQTAPAQVAASTPAPIVRSTTKLAPKTKAAKAAAAATPPRKPTPDTSVTLAANVAPRPSTIVPVPLGVGSAANAKPIVPRAIAHDAPSQECQRSSEDWPSRPLSIAVLDFRYPTEREESHDIALVGGGSGTAVADLVYNRLEQVTLQGQPEFTVDRGDRRRLDRTDIAGAARLGRQMGVDAVLAGTFNPIEQPAYDDGTPRPPIYELRAGLVDTCTGQVLMKLDSCAPGSDPAACRQTITSKQAANPAAFSQAFQQPVDTLLDPLEHNATSARAAQAALDQAAAVVTASSANTVTLRVTPGFSLHPGDQLALHASRLTKNPTTYTLNILQDQEIGRIAIRNIQGSTVTAAFTGDIPPKPGDTALRLSNP